MATETPSPTSLSAAAGISFVALTTPFVQPAECTKIRDLGSYTAQSYVISSGFRQYNISAIFSYADNPKFSACQPSGWESVLRAEFGGGGDRGMYFSPAVCPSSWEVVYMSTYFSGLSTVSGARCCMR